MKKDKIVILMVFNFKKKQLILTYSDYKTEIIKGNEAIKVLKELDFENE